LENLKNYISFENIKLDRIYPQGVTEVAPNFFYQYSILALFVLLPFIGFSQIDLTSETEPNSLKFSPKIKSEIGLHLGTAFITGDVPSQRTKGFGSGLYYRSALNHVVSFRYDLSMAKAFGLGANPYGEALTQDENIFKGYDQNNPYFFSYQTTIVAFGTDLLFELTNLAPQIKFKRWNMYLGIGLGLYNSNTKLNLKNEANLPYSNLLEQTSFNIDHDYNTLNGRKAIKSKLEEIYDGSYETSGPKKAGVFRLGNETNIYPFAKFTIGIARKLCERFNIGIEYSSIFSDNDLLDGNRWRTNQDLSNHNDVIHYVNIRLGYAINSTSEDLKSLFWVNPWDEQEERLRLEKELLDSLNIDTDLDGVPDINDLEKNSLPNCPVDRDGIVLDSDNDGNPDCLDSDPYLNDKLLQDKIRSILEQLSQENHHPKGTNTRKPLSMKESIDLIDSLLNKDAHSALVNHINTLLPDIYFKKNQYSIDPFSHKQIMSIAKILDQNSNLNVRISGHSSNEGEENYNYELSVKRSETIQKFLINKCNIDSKRIQIDGLGSSKAKFKSDQKFWFLDRKASFQFY
jgi:outer membrane protein OmpA-like peptidoglycan-associated protein